MECIAGNNTKTASLFGWAGGPKVVIFGYAVVLLRGSQALAGMGVVPALPFRLGSQPFFAECLFSAAKKEKSRSFYGLQYPMDTWSPLPNSKADQSK